MMSLTCRYPTNPVLRAITPKDTVRNLDVYPVKLTQVSGAPLLHAPPVPTYRGQQGTVLACTTTVHTKRAYAIAPAPRHPKAVTCRGIGVQDAILVDVGGAASTKFQSATSGSGRGGSDTSIDANNVFALQPRVYVEGSDPDGALARPTSPQKPTK